MNLYVRRLAEDLAGRGVEVDVFTRRTDRTTPREIISPAGARFIHLDAGPARRLPKSVLPLHVPAMVRALRDAVERDGAEYDVVHAHYWLSGMVGIRSRAWLEAPVVTMFHTLSKVKERYAGITDAGDSDLRGAGERCVIAGSDAVIGATAGEGDLMRELYGIAPRRYEVISPGVDLDRFGPLDRATSRLALGLGSEAIILFVGRFDPMKGADRLLRAFALVRDRLPCGTRLLLAGGGRESRALRRLATSLGLDDAVDFRGVVSPEEVSLYYSAADVCAVPSVYESFGMAAVEAMACGTPVVAFAVGGLAETVRDGRSGLLVPPGDEHAFADALVRALEPHMNASLRRHARGAMRSRSWDRGVSDLLALYDDLASAERCLCRRVAGA
jgi:D-inositol-3-phosphate glycosyltransferase